MTLPLLHGNYLGHAFPAIRPIPLIAFVLVKLSWDSASRNSPMTAGSKFVSESTTNALTLAVTTCLRDRSHPSTGKTHNNAMIILVMHIDNYPPYPNLISGSGNAKGRSGSRERVCDTFDVRSVRQVFGTVPVGIPDV